VTSENEENIVDQVSALFSRFVALDSGLPLVLALWCVGTHMHDSFDAFPYLAITSPTKRCGKTRLCEVMELVCHKPLRTVSISTAALYRLLDAGTRTLLIDEAEYLGRTRDERASTLREILNAGYRNGQSVYRCKKTIKQTSKNESEEHFVPEPHKTYCPKVLVLIGRLQDTLADRCIEVRMERRASVQLNRFRYARVVADTAPLRDELRAWSKKHAKAVEKHYQENDLFFLRDREAELWLPLFAVCAVAAPERLPELELVAKRLAESKSSDEPADLGIHLLKDVRELFTQQNADRLATFDLVNRLNSLEESPWGGWYKGRGLDAHALSRLLRPFKVTSQNIRHGEKVVKGYTKQSFEDSWTRYL
jgi:hypothetical protein